MSWLGWKYLSFCCVFLQTFKSNSFCYPAAYHMSKANNRNTRVRQIIAMSNMPDFTNQDTRTASPIPSNPISGFKHVKAAWP